MKSYIFLSYDKLVQHTCTHELKNELKSIELERLIGKVNMYK